MTPGLSQKIRAAWSLIKLEHGQRLAEPLAPWRDELLSLSLAITVALIRQLGSKPPWNNRWVPSHPPIGQSGLASFSNLWCFPAER